MERWWAYRMRDVQASADAVTAVDAFPTDLIVGLGVIIKGFEGDPEQFYVFVNADDPTAEQVAQIASTLAGFGQATSLTYADLMYKDPQPHLVASGPVESILLGLSATYPGRIREPRSN
jgi:hypothetical protein